MDKPVMITLTATAISDEEMPDTIQLLTSGTLTELEDGYMLAYEESLDETEPPQHVELRLTQRGVTMSRTGAYATDMVFRRGERFECLYNTPQGTLELALYCTKSVFNVGDEGGAVQLKYQLDMGGQYVAMHDLNLRFAFKKETVA